VKKYIGKVTPSNSYSSNINNKTSNNNNNLISLNSNNNNQDYLISSNTGGITVPKPKKKNDGFRFKNDKPKKGRLII